MKIKKFKVKGYMTEHASKELMAVKGLLETGELADLGPGPRKGVEAASALNRALEESLKDSSLPASKQEALKSLVFLWHDHLEDSHVISQNLPDNDGSYAHAIMHRREPDYSNSKYWFHRTGDHPAYEQLAPKVSAFLAVRSTSDLSGRLLPGESWDPFAFVDAVEETLRTHSSEETETTLKEIQKLEFDNFAEYLCRS